jgi:AcrR family transcriptional regulator
MTLSKRSQRKVDSILEHASMLFVRLGFHKVTMESIAQYANVSKVTLYKYFKDKQALYEDIILRQFDEEYELVKDIVTDLIPYEDKVFQMMSLHLNNALDRTKPTLDSEIILSIETTKQVKSHKAKMKRLRQKLYNQARMEEHVKEDLSDGILETYFHTILDGLIAQERRLSRMTPEELDSLLHLLLSSIEKAPE